MTSAYKFNFKEYRNKFLSRAEFNFNNKTALVRIDCDVELTETDFRLEAVLPTIRNLQKKGVNKIIMIGHRGRPGGREVEKLSLQPIADWFSENYQPCNLISLNNLTIEQLSNFCLLQNLRFHQGEKENNQEFAKKLSSLADIYINDAFATAHREHASLVGVPKNLPSFLGLRMEREIKTLQSVKNDSQRPLVFVLGGAKSGKLDYLEFLADWADKVLVGGKHPKKIKSSKLKVQSSNINIAELKSNNRDISEKSIKEFKQEIKKAKTIIWNGPMGVYEEKDNQKGTIEIAKAIIQAKAFKLAGGGDTHKVLRAMNIWDDFDFISTGGGATLQFLKQGNLPAIKAITDTN